MAAAVLFSATSIFAAQSTIALTDTTKTKKVKPANVQYTCTMHPEILSNKPGKCPKCGMTLVKKTNAKKKPAEK